MILWQWLQTNKGAPVIPFANLMRDLIFHERRCILVGQEVLRTHAAGLLVADVPRNPPRETITRGTLGVIVRVIALSLNVW